MPVFLFWNVHCKRLDDRIARIVQRHAVDVVVLAEYVHTTSELAERLPVLDGTPFSCVSEAGRVRVLSRLQNWRWDLQIDGQHWLVFRVRIRRVARPLLVVVAHLRSGIHTGLPTRRALASEMARRIRAEEGRRATAGTLLVGDLNLNPFDEGVVGTDALNAVSTRAKAGELTRSMGGTDYPMFYNPSWGLFGDRAEGRPPGTYYRSAGEQVNYFWNVFDQVLLRPSIMHWLTDLAVLDSDGVESLLTRYGLPDDRFGSDHLLVFRLDIPEAIL